MRCGMKFLETKATELNSLFETTDGPSIRPATVPLHRRIWRC